MGAQALILAVEGDNLVLAATLIALSAVIESLNERLTKWLKAANPFGERFAVLVDYATFIITPWVLMRALLIGRRNMFQEVLLDLPLLVGALRSARGGRSGLSPVFFAFVAVTGAFLGVQELMSTARLTMVLPPIVAALSLLMIAPVRYRALPATLELVVLALVAVMPFFQTELLAGAAVLLGAAYIIVGPFVGTKTPGTPGTTETIG